MIQSFFKLVIILTKKFNIINIYIYIMGFTITEDYKCNRFGTTHTGVYCTIKWKATPMKPLNMQMLNSAAIPPYMIQSTLYVYSQADYTNLLPLDEINITWTGDNPPTDIIKTIYDYAKNVTMELYTCVDC